MIKLPNWKTHLEVAKRLSSKLNYDEQNSNLFLLGNIIPDVNNGYIFKDIAHKISHSQTHFDNKNERIYINFYKEYKDLIKSNPIICGYFTHLCTDYIWNNYFYLNLEKLGILESDKNKLKIIKHAIFRKYNNEFIDNKIEIDNYDVAINYIKPIKNVLITESDLIHLKEFVNNQEKDNESIGIDEIIDKLDKLMNQTVVKIEAFLKNREDKYDL